MRYYYTDASNKTAGPVELDEIRALAASGKIASDPMVVAEGASDWRLLSSYSIPGAPPAPPHARKSVGDYATVMGDLVGKFVDLLGKLLNPKIITCALNFLRTNAHYAILLGMVLTFFTTLIYAIRYHEFRIFLVGIVFIVLLAIGQYVAKQFLDAGDKLVAATPSRLSSNTFMRCLALFAIIFAICIFIGGLMTSIQERTIMPFLVTIIVSGLLATFGAFALNPSSVNVETGSGSAGEEAVGLIMYFLKIGIKSVPVIFALYAVVGCIVLFWSLFTDSIYMGMLLPVRIDIPPALIGAALLVVACLVPLLQYIIFLIGSLFVDVLRAILVMPSKIDSLRDSRK